MLSRFGRRVLSPASRSPFVRQFAVGGTSNTNAGPFPTNKQQHGSSAETSHTNVDPKFSHSHGPIGVDRLVDGEPYAANWVDFRTNLVEVEVTRDTNGDLVGQWEGEDVIFPDLDTSLDFVLSTPVDVHLFEETPIIKECPVEDERH